MAGSSRSSVDIGSSDPAAPSVAIFAESNRVATVGNARVGRTLLSAAFDFYCQLRHPLDRPFHGEDNPRYSACRNPPAARSRAGFRFIQFRNSIGDIAVEDCHDKI